MILDVLANDNVSLRKYWSVDIKVRVLALLEQLDYFKQFVFVSAD